MEDLETAVAAAESRDAFHAHQKPEVSTVDFGRRASSVLQPNKCLVLVLLLFEQQTHTSMSGDEEQESP